MANAVVSKNVLERTKKELVAATKRWDKGLCYGFHTDLEGKNKRWAVTYCHAWLSDCYFTYQLTGRLGVNEDGAYKDPNYTAYETKPNAQNFLIANCHSRELATCSKEACDFLIRWVAHESPFSEFILNKDDDDNLVNGGVVVLCGPDGLNYTEAMWMFKVLRFHTEGSQAADTFMELVKAGVDGMLAIFVANYYRSVNKNKFNFTGLMGHLTTIREGDADVLAWVARKTRNDVRESYDLFKFSKNEERPKDYKILHQAKIKSFSKPVKIDDGWGKAVEVEASDKQAFIKEVLAWQDEIGKHVDIKAAQAVRFRRGVPIEIKDPPPPPMPTASTVYLDLDL